MIIYKITNNINSKVYIGQTIGNPKRRIDRHFRDKSSCPIMQAAVQKYGKENFSWEVIDNANSIEELNEKEIYWIEKYNSTSKEFGYNVHKGGLNRTPNEETRLKYSIRSSGKNNGMYGRKQPQSVKDAISKANQGHKYRLGKKHTKESIEKMRLSHLGKPAAFKGKKHTEETRKILSEIAKNRTDRKRAVLCITNNKIYNSIKEAGEDLGIARGNISLCASNKREFAAGHKFQYLEGY